MLREKSKKSSLDDEYDYDISAIDVDECAPITRPIFDKERENQVSGIVIMNNWDGVRHPGSNIKN